MSFSFKDLPSQENRIAIVTGANTGLGFETTKWLVKKKLKVIMACRNIQKASSARQDIMETIPNADLELMELDLSNLNSVREFVKAYQSNYERLDLLINNAGVMVPPYTKTSDGFELQMGVNYFGHFLLTNLLLPVLNKTPNARVVSLSSNAHKSGKIKFDNLHGEKGYSRFGAYAQSKLACLMFAFELQRRLEQQGQDTLSVAAHPGVSDTELGRYVPKTLYKILMPVFGFMTHDPQEASLPTVMAALDPDVKGGQYFGPQGFNEMKGKPGLAKVAPQASDEDVARRLWEVSEKEVGLR